MRTPDQLEESALRVIDQALSLSIRIKTFSDVFPLFSGGYDSLCACYIASKHPRFGGEVFHINTGIGSQATRKYVEEVCEEFGWKLRVYKSPATYEEFVSKLGFPGPGSHQWVYNWLKDRAVQMMTSRNRWSVLLTGCRSGESIRRMGHVEPVKVGETSKKTGKVSKPKRIWVAPCHDWSDEEQRAFLSYHDFPRNPVKDSMLGMSGECFCGAFARPNEMEMLRQFCPDVAEKIDRLAKLAKNSGIEERNQSWGHRGKKTIEVVETGPMCSSCDRRASAAGIIVKRSCYVRPDG